MPKIATVREGNNNYLDLKSRDSSYGLEHEVDVDPHQAPYLTWKWNVKELPAGGDFRRSKTDDQAAQVLVAFADKRVLSYIWDTTAPAGIMESASSIPLVHIYAVVCRSGAADLNRWLTENRNLGRRLREGLRPSRAAGKGHPAADQHAAHRRLRRELLLRSSLPQRSAVMILVTGGTGFIGEPSGRASGGQRAARCGAWCGDPARLASLPRGVELAHGDLESRAGLTEALRGVDTVIHLAGVTKARTAADYDRGNAVATANLLRAADRLSGSRGSFTSAAWRRPVPAPPIGRSPRRTNRAPSRIMAARSWRASRPSRNSPLADRTVIVRPPVVYGPRRPRRLPGVAHGRAGMDGANRHRAAPLQPYLCGRLGGWSHRRGRSHLRRRRRRRSFYLANAMPVSWDEFGRVAARLMGREVRTVAIPESAANVLGLCAEWWTRLSGKPGILSRDKVREACCTGWVCDPGRARRELGFRASTGLKKGCGARSIGTRRRVG